MKADFNVREILPCLFAVFVDILGFSLAMPVLIEVFSSSAILPLSTPEMARFLYLAIGLSLYPVFMFFGSSFMGDLSDIIGRKKVLTICMGGFVFGFFIMGLGVNTHTLLYIFCGRALTGLTAASLAVTLAAVSDLSTPVNKATHMSLVVFVQSIGIVLGPLMAGLLSSSKLISFGSIALPFYTASFFALIALFGIGWFFQESFERGIGKKIQPLRLILVFVEVVKHPRVRILVSAFLFNQIGIGLYIQLILVYLSKQFHYTGLGLGLFNASLGLWLCIGLTLIPLLAKRFRIEWIACGAMACLGLAELFAAVSKVEVLLWISTVFVGVFGNIAWSAMLTSFSESVDSNAQGWAMGITGAVVSLSFILSSFSPTMVPSFGALPLIGIGGFLTLLSAMILFFYCRHKLPIK